VKRSQVENHIKYAIVTDYNWIPNPFGEKEERTSVSGDKIKNNFIEGNVQWWFFAIIFIAIFLRVFNFTSSSLWTDEFSTLWAANAPSLSDTIQRASMTQGMHPTYFIIQRAILSILPANEATLRGLSCAASIVSVFLIFWLGRIIFADDTRALLASAIFAIHADSIYYAQEARPYALGIMFALLSQIFFMRFSKDGGLKNILAYIAPSLAAVFLHYTFAALFIFQNLYVFVSYYFKLKKIPLIQEAPSLKSWISVQTVCLILLGFSMPHVSGLYDNRTAWNWVRNLDFQNALYLFVSMFDLDLIGFMLGIAALFFIMERFSPATAILRLGKNASFTLLLWIISPFIFVFAASRILDVSFFDPRYMLFSMPAYYLILANLLDIFRSDILRTAFPGIYLILYFGYVSIPSYMKWGAFCRRVPHDWRSAIVHIRDNYEPGDAILLRCGEVKENWIASENVNPIVKDYVKAPFHSFYWDKDSSVPLPTIFNMTYTWEKEFYTYYEETFSNLVAKKRVWLIGVDPPNTNYKFSTVAQFMHDEYMFKKLSS